MSSSSANPGVVLFVSTLFLLISFHDPKPPPLTPLEQQARNKQERYERLLPKLTMKRTMYDNISMHAPDDRFVCTVSLKKARWYIKKELADACPFAEGESLSKITLRFHPDKSELEGKSEEQVKFQQRVKKNICVACGSDSGQYMRHYIVPSTLRHWFPKKYKSHHSHDIVILCPACHARVMPATGRRLTGMERVAIFRQPPAARDPHIIIRENMEVHNAAVALDKHAGSMPALALEKHRQRVARWCGVEASELGAECIRKAIGARTREDNPLYVCPAKLIVEAMGGDDEELAFFVKEWRRFFTETAEPKHMPEGWGIDSPVTNESMVDLRGGGFTEYVRKTDEMGRDLPRTFHPDSAAGRRVAAE